MGDPRKSRKKYRKPGHPWEKGRIEEEKEILREHGLQNKKEIWKANSLLLKFKRQAKRLTAREDEQAKKEEVQLLEKLRKYGLISKDSKLGDVLNLNIRDVLNRRLQTLVFKRGLAKTIKQARQLVIHRHIAIDGKRVSVPSYIVNHEEESKIDFSKSSPFIKEDHPERAKEKPKEEEKKVLEKKEGKKKVKEEKKKIIKKVKKNESKPKE